MPANIARASLFARAPARHYNPLAEQMERSGGSSRVLRVWKTVRLRSTGQLVQYMRFGAESLRPIIWLHSYEYPMSPPWGMCADAAERGYGIVSVRRPGFGHTSDVASAEDEVALISAFLDEMKFEEAILIAEGSSAMAGTALGQRSERIALTLLARPSFGSSYFGDVMPAFQNIMLQAMQTTAGARISKAALKQIAHLKGPASLYESFTAAPGDIEFLRYSARDFGDAWACASSMSDDAFRRELRTLQGDASLKRNALADFKGIAVIGAEGTDGWRRNFEARAAELSIRQVVLPRGALFALYLDTDALIQLIETELGIGPKPN
jgi:pimeloyl-ACP methyl ester carboxylesterase